MEESLKDDSALAVLMKCQTTDIFWWHKSYFMEKQKKTEKADLRTVRNWQKQRWAWSSSEMI